jgi:hypothetical protein
MSAIVLNASDMLAEYTFDGNSATATNVDSVINMGDWIANAGDISSENANIATTLTPTDINPATDSSYHTFSFTVQNLKQGEFLSVTSVSGDFFGTGLHPGNHNIQLYSDQVGYDNTSQRLDGATIEIDDGTSSATSANFDISTSTTSALSNLGNGETVEFRFYFSDSADHSGRISRLDNIQLNGVINAAVPEPASCALVTALVAAVMLGCRRPRAAFA